MLHRSRTTAWLRARQIEAVDIAFSNACKKNRYSEIIQNKAQLKRISAEQVRVEVTRQAVTSNVQ
jgi:hypothetical protein